MSSIKERVGAMAYWYHRIELPDGTVTNGAMPFAPEAYRLPDFKGKRVLDAGSWDGYFTWEALKGGASEVIAIDDFSDCVNFDSNFKAWATWDLCREAFGFRNCDRLNISLYDVTPERFGLFDYVLFYGVLYHCRHPLLALDKLSAVCKGEIRVETAICDDFSAYRGGLKQGYASNASHCIAEFYPRNEYGANPTNWWAPNMNCLKGMMEAAGFTVETMWKYQEPDHVSHCRGFAIGKKGVVL
jgi:tRNA (mo5U34)-methyltransferase